MYMYIYTCVLNVIPELQGSLAAVGEGSPQGGRLAASLEDSLDSGLVDIQAARVRNQGPVSGT